MGQYTFQVAGMQCAGCENIIQSTLSDVNNVDSVDADYRTGTVEVTANGAEKDVLIEELSKVGYEVEGQ